MTRLQSIFPGQKYLNRNKDTLEVLEYHDCERIKVKFINNNDNEYQWVTAGQIRAGNVKNRNTPTIYGVGYIGYGKFEARNSKGKITKEYSTWSGILKRCYSGEDKYHTYFDVVVCEDWLNFQKFAEWMSLQKGAYLNEWFIDKDISQSRIYSPETCFFVPRKINNIFSEIGERKSSFRGVVEHGNGFLAQCGSGKDRKTRWFKSEIRAREQYLIFLKELLEKRIKIYESDLDEKCLRKLKEWDLTQIN